jgi:hypothetical protein
VIVPLLALSTIFSPSAFKDRPETIALAQGALGASFILEVIAFAQGAVTLLVRLSELVVLERVGARAEVEFVPTTVAFEAICGVRDGGA